MLIYSVVVFFFKQKTAYEMRISDWSSDVCSSDLQDMVELRIAHMGVDLRRVADDAGGQPEAIDSPVEIMLPIALHERQNLAQRGLIDLDRLGAGGFEIDRLVADRERDQEGRRDRKSKRLNSSNQCEARMPDT